MGISPILHPTDFSSISTMAYELACSLARDQARPVVLLHILESARARAAGETNGIGALKRQEAWDRLQRMRKDVSDVWIETIVARGNPVSAIVSLARDLGCGLIVLGTQGQSLTKSQLALVAEQIVCRAACPVLRVQSPDDQVVKPARVMSHRPEPDPAPGGLGPDRRIGRLR